MKILFLSLILMLSGITWAATPIKKDSVKVPVKVSVQKSGFETTISVLKKQLADIEQTKTSQKTSIEKLEKESAVLSTKSDSVYAFAKTALKAVYDSELSKLNAQDQALKVAKDRLEADYQEALKALEEVKGVKSK